MYDAEDTFAAWNRRIPVFDAAAADAARKRWNSIAKPAGSLGLLEEAVTRIAGLTGDPRYAVDKRAILVLCADNGVVRQGVALTGGEVTAILASCLARGQVSVCAMAAVARADVIGVDMGMNRDLRLDGLLSRRIAAGARDLSVGPAMTRDQALQAIRHGAALAEDCADRGYRLLGTGEIGIGNTTTSAAMAAALLGKDPAEVAGRGSGLSPEGVARKAEIIRRAIAVNRPDPADPLDVLSKLGGFDIAGLAGVFIGGAMRRIPVLVDGLISSIAALTALRLCPACGVAMLATHVSAEPAGKMVLDALGLRPLLFADMRLGEGTGAAAMMPLLDMAYAVYDNMITYEDMAIGQYQPAE